MKKSFSTILFLLVTIFIFSEDLSVDLLNTFFSKEEQEKMLDGKFITRMCIKFNAKGENTHLFIKIPVTKWTPENLSSYEIITDDKIFIPYQKSKVNEEHNLNFLNFLTSYRKLAGMVYYSRSSNNIETLIKKSYRLDDKDKKIDDPKYDKVISYTKNKFLQEDNKFGTTYFDSEVYNIDNSFIMVNSNNKPISKGIKIGDKGDYKVISFFIYDDEKEGYYCYFLNAFRINNDNLLKGGLLRPTTFSNRLRAAIVFFLKFLGKDYSSELNPWDEKTLKSGGYKQY